MDGLTPKHAGIALAALLAGDRDADRVRAALASSLVGGLPRRDSSQSPRSAVSALLAQVRPALDARIDGLPLRLVALIAPRLPPEAARARLRDGAPARAGFTLSAGFMPRLLRIARHSQERARP